MATRDDLDGLATGRRATRHKNVRARQARQLVGRTEWLDDLLVFWTGRRETIPRIGTGPLPLRAILQDRLAHLPRGLYAVRCAAAGNALYPAVRSAVAVDHTLVAVTARAIEALAKFPKAAKPLIGAVPGWCEQARRKLYDRRRAIGCIAPRSPGGSAEPCVPAAFLAIGGGARPAGAPRGPARTPFPEELDSTLVPAWDDECFASGASSAGTQRADLARLAPALAAIRREPARRHDIMRRIAAEYLRLGAARNPDGKPLAQEEIHEKFHDLVLSEAYHAAEQRSATWQLNTPDSPVSLVERWIGEPIVDGRPWEYVDHLCAEAARTLGRSQHWFAAENPPTSLSEHVPPGSVLDPAGPVAVVAIARRLVSTGASDACGALAAWLDACRPLSRLATFWDDVLAILPKPAAPLDAARAEALVASLRAHARALATDVALTSGEPAGSRVRAVLPAVLVRGPDATGRVLRWSLWEADEPALDAALGFVEAVERIPRAVRFGDPIPVPRGVFSCEDRALRDALLEIGRVLWEERALESGTVVWLLERIQGAAARSGSAPWSRVLPQLHDIARFLVRRMVDRRKAQGCISFGSVADCTFILLDICGRWIEAGFEGTRRLARVLSDRWPSADEAAGEWDAERGDHNDLTVRLAEGRIPRFLALLSMPPAPRQHDWRAIDGWHAVGAHPAARAWVSACLDRTELAARVVRLLERVALALRLEPGLRPKRLFAPLDRAVDTPPWPSWVGPDDAAMLADVVRAGIVAGMPGGIPAVLQRILDRRDALIRERAALQGRIRTRWSPSGRARASHLDEMLASPERLDEELRRALRKVLPKQWALTGLAALEALAARDLERHWRVGLAGREAASLDTRAWDNALLMLHSVHHNRRVLRRLLQREARGDRSWMRSLGPNRAFLDRLAASGARSEEWLAGRARTIDLPGNAFTAYVSTDPLEVLQMGSLFGTCLSADRFNAHAAVAAAVEVNKRVLYVKDSEGRILGRQLLAIIRSGEVIGFTHYGAGLDDERKTGSWVRLALGLLTLDIVRASGVTLASAARIGSGLSSADEDSVSLFCVGYIDTVEYADWWIEMLASREPAPGASDRDRLRSLLQEPVPPERDARQAPGWRRDELGWETCRALLWLGREAPELPPDQQQALGLSSVHLRALGLVARGTGPVD